ncbi:universal stress protein [Mucilaginibacter sp. RS28]|uniref:Universal stress protein n=1 Tax=Mucilaginibacter straminoryzae TaxID=2932774 RepID=A0A9X2B7B1_9SPHI|nr:universal stress protein [Mucilaginibacter straminoryzae]MCJ8208349.1 universal stress protein [Mucilaginibacter straminoryzae]
MKTILVLTDFSETAQYAADAAIAMAGKIKANVLLLNTFVTVPMLPSDEAANWQMQEYFLVQNSSKQQLQKELERLENHLKTSDFEPGKPVIKTLCEYGGLADSVTTLIHSHHVGLVVMGGRTKTDMPFLLGDSIKAVINHIHLPVMIVPHKMHFDKITRVTFATDLAAGDLKAIGALAEIVGLLHFDIQIVHVMEPALVPDLREEAAIARFREQVAALKIKNISYQTIFGEDVTHQLEQYNQKHHVGLLAMVHKKHAFLWRLFNQQPCMDMISNHQMPLLIYPEIH